MLQGNKKDALLDAGQQKEGTRLVMVSRSPRQKGNGSTRGDDHVTWHLAKTVHLQMPAHLLMPEADQMSGPEAMRL